MRSVKKYYGDDRIYDFEEFNTMLGKRFSKKRAHKRLRKQLREELRYQ